jgi:hypothetical protein
MSTCKWKHEPVKVNLSPFSGRVRPNIVDVTNANK